MRTRVFAESEPMRPLAAVAVDGPLTSRLHLVSRYRSAEAILSRGVLQGRGKPGQTSSPVGQKLHHHATELAFSAANSMQITNASHSDAIHSTALVEAFPNLFLAALMDECDIRTLSRDASDRYWEALVDRSKRLFGLISHLLPGRTLSMPLERITNHEHRAVEPVGSAPRAARSSEPPSGENDDPGDVLAGIATFGAQTSLTTKRVKLSLAGLGWRPSEPGASQRSRKSGEAIPRREFGPRDPAGWISDDGACRDGRRGD